MEFSNTRVEGASPEPMHRLIGRFLLPALAFGACGAALATETHVGAFTLTREAAVKGSYDTNIFLTSSSEYTSGIATFSHNLGILYDQRRTRVALEYDISVIQYDRYPGTNNAVNQEGSFDVRRETGPASVLTASDDFKATNDPASSELVERTRRNQNDAIGSFEAGLGPDLFAGVDLHHTLHDYLKQSLGELLNRKLIDVTPRIGIKLTEKTRIYAEATYEKVGYESPTLGGAGIIGNIKDNSSNQVEVAASGEFTSRLTGKIGAGVLMKKYVNTVTTLTDSVTLPTWNAAVTWEAPADFTVVVALSQTAQEGLYNRFNVSMLNMVQVIKPLTKKLVGSCFAMAVLDTYPDLAPGATSTVKRKDTTVQGGLTLDYSARDWLVVEASFLYRARNSTLDLFDYNDQVTGLSVEAKY